MDNKENNKTLFKVGENQISLDFSKGDGVIIDNPNSDYYIGFQFSPNDKGPYDVPRHELQDTDVKICSKIVSMITDDQSREEFCTVFSNQIYNMMHKKHSGGLGFIDHYRLVLELCKKPDYAMANILAELTTNRLPDDESKSILMHSYLWVGNKRSLDRQFIMETEYPYNKDGHYVVFLRDIIRQVFYYIDNGKDGRLEHIK